MEDKSFIAKSNNIRESAQKVRLTAKMVKKMHPEEAIQLLEYVNQKAARFVKNTIKSAVSNALRENANMDGLIISTIKIDSATTFPRVRSGSRGHVHRIHKRGCHIFVELSERKV